MHSSSYRYLSINKPGVWVICGMAFHWNVRSYKFLEMTTLNVTTLDNTSIEYHA